MLLHDFLSKLTVQAITNGDLLFDEENHSVRFRLRGEQRSVSGHLLLRPDWIDAFGRPGVMPILESLETSGNSLFEGKPFNLPVGCIETVYDCLRERLAPERIFVLDEDSGWLLTSFNSTVLNTKNSAAA